MGIRTGAEYLAGLRDGREVWLEGERVQDVAAHPRLGRTARTIAALYDLQHDPALHEQMTFPSPSSGEPVALSYLIPQTTDDLLRRRRALEVIAEYSNGMLGRSPDYVNIQVSASAACHAVYGAKEKRFGDNLRAYHEYIRERDLALTHTFGHPQVNRGAAVGDQPDPYIPLGVVDTAAEGVIVRGAKLLAPFADELFVPPYRPLGASEAMYALGFAIPMNTPGLSLSASMPTSRKKSRRSPTCWRWCAPSCGQRRRTPVPATVRGSGRRSNRGSCCVTGFRTPTCA